METEEVKKVELPEKKCYICGRTQDDLDKINEILLADYEGDLKEYYRQCFGLKLESKEVTRAQLNSSDIRVDWPEVPNDYRSLRSHRADELYHPNEERDLKIQASIKHGVAEVSFVKDHNGMSPILILNNDESLDEDIRNKYASIVKSWNPFENSPNSDRYYFAEGILKQFRHTLKVHICTICECVQLPGIKDDGDDRDDRRHSYGDSGLEYGNEDQDNWGD